MYYVFTYLIYEFVFNLFLLLNSDRRLITTCLDFHRPNAACDANWAKASTDNFFTGFEATEVRNARHSFTLGVLFMLSTHIFNDSQLRKIAF